MRWDEKKQGRSASMGRDRTRQNRTGKDRTGGQEEWKKRKEQKTIDRKEPERPVVNGAHSGMGSEARNGNGASRPDLSCRGSSFPCRGLS